MRTNFLTPFKHYKYLLWQLTLRDIKSRYKQSVIGYAWIILNPLAQLLVYSFVFSIVIRFPTNNVPYSIFLFTALLPWTFLQSSLTAATMSLVDNSDLIRKVYFPREVFSYSLITAKALDFSLSALVLLGFMIYYKTPVHLTLVFIIPLFIIQVILMAGLSLIFSALNLFYRDIQYLINLTLMLWMYLTPIIYPISLVPKEYLFFYKLNPMVGIIEGYRSSIFNEPFDVYSITYAAVFSIIFFIFTYIFFKKSEGVFADIV